MDRPGPSNSHCSLVLYTFVQLVLEDVVPFHLSLCCPKTRALQSDWFWGESFLVYLGLHLHTHSDRSHCRPIFSLCYHLTRIPTWRVWFGQSGDALKCSLLEGPVGRRVADRPVLGLIDLFLRIRRTSCADLECLWGPVGESSCNTGRKVKLVQ